ncbi:hypothetical protein ACP70R_034402 [Stipagrostis hirtigluma subsp. patula]
MCTLAPRAALCLGATAGERPRAAVASMACGGMASAPAQKRARNSFDNKRKVPAPALRLLGERMEAELDAVLGLLKKAELLSRNAAKCQEHHGRRRQGSALLANKEEEDVAIEGHTGGGAEEQRTREAAAAQGPARHAADAQAPDDPPARRGCGGSGEAAGGDCAREGEVPAGAARGGEGGAARRDDLPGGLAGARHLRVCRDSDEEAGTARARMSGGADLWAPHKQAHDLPQGIKAEYQDSGSRLELLRIVGL